MTIHKTLLLASTAAALLATSTPSWAQTTISAYMNSLYSTTSEPVSAPAMSGLIEEYKKLKPDVTIEPIDNMSDVNAYQAWLTTRFAGGDQPDIAWQQYFGSDPRVIGRTGWSVTFQPWFDQVEWATRILPSIWLARCSNSNVG